MHLRVQCQRTRMIIWLGSDSTGVPEHAPGSISVVKLHHNCNLSIKIRDNGSDELPINSVLVFAILVMSISL